MAKRNEQTASKYNNMLSASSFLDLKAELSKKESEFEATREALGTTSTQGAVKRPGKKPTAWQRSNSGVQHRRYKDEVVYENSINNHSSNPEYVKSQLEKKAALYDKIKRGRTAGLTEAQIDSLLVDFDQHQDDDWSDDSDSGQDSQQGDSEYLSGGQSDPMVEWTDEFGRTRMVRQSEVPRGTAVAVAEEPQETNVTYGDQHIFPVYQPSEEEVAARKVKFAQQQQPLVQHYDASTENRSRGAGFMAFSKNEKERQAQMEALKNERNNTVRQREHVQESGGVVGEHDRAKDERKRKLEIKRRELEAKRMKKAQQP